MKKTPYVPDDKWLPEDYWSKHPDYPPSDWATEAENGDTRSSYPDWVSEQIRQHAFNHQQALGEGWCIIDVDGSGYLEIERDDECDEFKTDPDALWFVIEKARGGSEYHREALKLVGVVIGGASETRPTV